jgi:hypothetical protein
MSESSAYAKTADRWANELWNVSLFPAVSEPANELTPSGLENLDETRSRESFPRTLRIGQDHSSGILV